MNNKRRNMLHQALSMLSTASEIVFNALEEEQDKLCNVSENLQETERYENMEAAVENLDEVSSYINSAIEGIEDAIAYA